MKRIFTFGFLLLALGQGAAEAQQLLSLDSCRAMALRNNKQMGVQQLKQDIAANLRKSARTKYLPHVSAIGSYQFTSEEISILNNEQKGKLSNLGTNLTGSLSGLGNTLQTTLGQMGTMLGQLGVPAEAFQQMAGQLQQNMQQTSTNMAGLLDSEGQKIVDAFRTDTRHIFAGSVLVTQPIFMGGGIVALNKLADINEEFANNSVAARRQGILYSTDQAYWQVVSLSHKKRLAESYLELVRKLDSDVGKMITDGVATRSDALSVSVKVNEAEMALTKVTDGLTLSKMLLCQICGLPVSESEKLIVKSEEGLARRPEGESQFASAQGGEASIAAANRLSPSSAAADSSFFTLHSSFENRPELRMLQNTVDISRQATNLMKAGNQPQVMLTGGYAVSNPNTFNGFERKFSGFWNVGVLVRVPVWNWGDVRYKVRASKGLTAIRQLELDETREKIELQVSQSSFRVDEARKRLALAQASIARADENLHTANVGFKEGVITPTTVMEAQTAWLQAQSERVDAEIEVRMAHTDLKKSLGTLGNNQ